MNLAEFLAALGRDGTLVYESSQTRELEPAEEAEAVRCLEEMDARCRLELVGPVPALNREQAIWAARKMFRVGQFLLFRELSAEAIVRELSDDCPGNDDVARQYSVDLTLCWLPHLHARAAGISEADELTKALERLGESFPLSSVRPGVAARFETMWRHESLRSLYVDRVITTQARACLNEARVRFAVRDALGARCENAAWLPR